MRVLNGTEKRNFVMSQRDVILSTARYICVNKYTGCLSRDIAVTYCAMGKRFGRTYFNNRVVQNSCQNVLSLTIDQLSLVMNLCRWFAGLRCWVVCQLMSVIMHSLTSVLCHAAACCAISCLHVSYRLHSTVVMNFVHENTFSAKMSLPWCGVRVFAYTCWHYKTVGSYLNWQTGIAESPVCAFILWSLDIKVS